MTTIENMHQWAEGMEGRKGKLFIGAKEIDYMSEICPIDEVRQRVGYLVILHKLKSVRAENGDSGYWIKKEWF
jgi:hypothetical protein